MERSTAVQEAVCINDQSKTFTIGNIRPACWLVRIELSGYKSILKLLISVHNCSHDVFSFVKFGKDFMRLETICQPTNNPQQFRRSTGNVRFKSVLSYL